MAVCRSSFNIFIATIALVFIASSLDAYARPTYASKEVWEKIEPYLLPEDHPAKPALDRVFRSSRAILNLETMEKAGFVDPFPRKWTHVIVCRHKNIPGYIIKTYLDAQRHFKGIPEYEHWLKRIRGIELINSIIQTYNLENYFTCPKKWIYPLPEEPHAPKEFVQKNYILVEEDMNLLKKKDNELMWQSSNITPEFLSSFFFLLEEAGLNDCAKPDNAPFTVEGKIAFIDTESNQLWPVDYSKLTPYLSSEMKVYWKNLIKKLK